jgi:hypothetical protein
MPVTSSNKWSTQPCQFDAPPCSLLLLTRFDWQKSWLLMCLCPLQPCTCIEAQKDHRIFHHISKCVWSNIFKCKFQVSLLTQFAVQVTYPWLAVDVYESVFIAKYLSLRMFLIFCCHKWETLGHGPNF